MKIVFEQNNRILIKDNNEEIKVKINGARELRFQAKPLLRSILCLHVFHEFHQLLAVRQSRRSGYLHIPLRGDCPPLNRGPACGSYDLLSERTLQGKRADEMPLMDTDLARGPHIYPILYCEL